MTTKNMQNILLRATSLRLWSNVWRKWWLRYWMYKWKREEWYSSCHLCKSWWLLMLYISVLMNGRYNAWNRSCKCLSLADGVLRLSVIVRSRHEFNLLPLRLNRRSCYKRPVDDIFQNVGCIMMRSNKRCDIGFASFDQRKKVLT